MNSVYHILHKHPAIYPEDIQIEYEYLAQELVKSGRLRIDTDYYRNFVHYNDPVDKINFVFSHAELTNPDLVRNSYSIIKQLYKTKNKRLSNDKLKLIINNLNNKLKKLLMVSDELTIRLARIFVQSAHPIVIHWLLYDRVQVFITYSNSIGDVMNIQNWKHSGKNSGMQSTDGHNVCIYVSCGGNPFTENNKKSPKYGDGWAALARLQIIAGQEIGHYADIKRDYQGNQITRHSANFACTQATPHVKEGRKRDISRCNNLLNLLLKNGMSNLIELERKLKFYDQQKISGIQIWWLKILIYIYRNKLFSFAHKNKLYFIKNFYQDKYTGLMIAAMIEDMQSHLAPIADVYKRDDPEAEEAISCVEALARVPQQVMKWGHLTTRATMRDLYKIYYKEVIPSLIDNYNHLANVKYQRNYSVRRQNIIQNVFQKILQFIPYLGKKKFKFNEVRDV